MSRLATLIGRVKHSGRLQEANDRQIDVDTNVPVAADVLHEFVKSMKSIRQYDSSIVHNAVAEDLIADLAEQGLSLLQNQPDARLPTKMILSLETIIKADGSRPCLKIVDGAADLDHPMARQWREQLVLTRSHVARIAGATGRVQPRNGSSAHFFGTCFLFDRNARLALTNRHVAVAAIRKSIGVHAAVPGRDLLTSFKFHGNPLTVEFDGEHGSTRAKQFSVEEILLPPWPWSVDRPTMDIAVLRLAPSTLELPEAVSVSTDASFEQEEILTSVAVVGFPGQPQDRAGVTDGVDWAWVDRELFGEVYGVKRLAPCIVHQSPNADPASAASLTFGHDASTLGGSSGSGMYAWLDGAAAFGIHFAGISADSNRAHGFSPMPTAVLLNQFGIVQVR